MRNQKHGILALLILSTSLFSIGQSITPVIRIRTITAGITLDNLSDTAEFLNAVYFLKKAKSVFVSKKYEVQTLRIATQNFYKYAGSPPYDKTIPQLVALDRIAERNGVIFSIGQVI
ncbi:MAG TPA: DUF711 family protein, partial [Chitinophagaceae bacterium]|nr:DUF711 family protein [Chitinophagaceae bacterium]